MTRKVIAIDGLAGTGKTSLSKALARELGFVHLSTGAIYRALAYLALQHAVPVNDVRALQDLLSRHSIALKRDPESSSSQIIVDGNDVSENLYGPEISEATSKVAQVAEVRDQLRNIQRDAFPGSDIVAEGRDMGTVIFPDADLKFFIEVDPEVSAERRLQQICDEKNVQDAQELAELKEKMKIEIQERNERDQRRVTAPTIAAEDALRIDNSTRPFERVLDEMLRFVREKLGIDS